SPETAIEHHDGFGVATQHSRERDHRARGIGQLGIGRRCAVHDLGLLWLAWWCVARARASQGDSEDSNQTEDAHGARRYSHAAGVATGRDAIAGSNTRGGHHDDTRFSARRVRNAAPGTLRRVRNGSNGPSARAAKLLGGKKTAPCTFETVHPALRASSRSSDRDQNRARRQVLEPSQPRTRRSAAHTLNRPSSPNTSRPPGTSTRAISRTASRAFATKQRTVTAVTTSKEASSKGSASALPCRRTTSTPRADARARIASSISALTSNPVTLAPSTAASIA